MFLFSALQFVLTESILPQRCIIWPSHHLDQLSLAFVRSNRLCVVVIICCWRCTPHAMARVSGPCRCTCQPSLSLHVSPILAVARVTLRAVARVTLLTNADVSNPCHCTHHIFLPMHVSALLAIASVIPACIVLASPSRSSVCLLCFQTNHACVQFQSHARAW